MRFFLFLFLVVPNIQNVVAKKKKTEHHLPKLLFNWTAEEQFAEIDPYSVELINLFFPREFYTADGRPLKSPHKGVLHSFEKMTQWRLRRGPAVWRIIKLDCGQHFKGHGLTVSVFGKVESKALHIASFTCSDPPPPGTEIRLPEEASITLRPVTKLIESSPFRNLMLLSQFRIDVSNIQLYNPGESVALRTKGHISAWRDYDSWLITPHDKMGSSLAVMQAAVTPLDIPFGCVVHLRFRDLFSNGFKNINISTRTMKKDEFFPEVDRGERRIVIPLFGKSLFHYDAQCVTDISTMQKPLEHMRSSFHLHVTYLSDMMSQYPYAHAVIRDIADDRQIQLWTPGYPHFSPIIPDTRGSNKTSDTDWFFTYEASHQSIITIMPSSSTKQVHRILYVLLYKNGTSPDNKTSFEIHPEEKGQVILVRKGEVAKIHYFSDAYHYDRTMKWRIGFQINIEEVDGKALEAYLKTKVIVKFLNPTNVDKDVSRHKRTITMMRPVQIRRIWQAWPPVLMVLIAWVMMLFAVVYSFILLRPYLRKIIV